MRGDFEGVVGVAAVSAGVAGDEVERVFVGGEFERAQAAFGVRQGAVQQRGNLLLGELLEDVNAAAGEQSADDFKGRIFGSGADEADGAALDVGQECVLLSFVEAMDFVDEEDGA